MRPRSLFLLLLLLSVAPAALAQYEETIVVSRYVVELRVTERDGTPLKDLTAEELFVDVGGIDAEVESVEWIDDVAPAFDGDGQRRGRLFVLLIQTDFARGYQRTAGQMKFNHYLDRIVADLKADDRMAVFSFDSHLKFRRDLTSDPEEIKQAIRECLRIDHPPAPPQMPEPSLAPHLDAEAMKRAAHTEQALLLLARALGQIEGMKTLLIAGWGLGQVDGGALRFHRSWNSAMPELRAARTTVIGFSTVGGPLSLGLEATAKTSGGFSVQTSEHAQQAVTKTRNTLAGHYEVAVRAPEGLGPGVHRLNVKVKRRGAVVLNPSFVVEQP